MTDEEDAVAPDGFAMANSVPDAPRRDRECSMEELSERRQALASCPRVGKRDDETDRELVAGCEDFPLELSRA